VTRHARNTDPDTSHEAAHTVDATRLEAKVYATLKENGDLTSKEISIACGEEYCSITPRMVDMEIKGLVWRVGRRKNPNSNRSAIVWSLKPPDLSPQLSLDLAHSHPA